MLNRIGVFHFGSTDKSQPLASLQSAIEVKLAENGESYLRDSLVVLPEAFNLRQPYRRADKYEFEDDIKGRLAAMAEQHDVVFVVGLIDNDGRDATPYSSAYLITKACCCRLSRKVGKDDLANGNWGANAYRACEFAPAACDAPVLHHKETCIAALICMDATVSPSPHLPHISNTERHEALRNSIGSLGISRTILCVPANTIYLNATGVASEWPDTHFALSNSWKSYTKDSPSVVRIKGHEPISCLKQENVLILETVTL